MSATVFIFGVFDGIHDGHRFFVEQAAQLGDTLIISVANDDASESLKNRRPKRPIEERMAALAELFPKATLIKGDTQAGSWHGLLAHKPQIIALGYDQDRLHTALEQARATLPFSFEIRTLEDFRGSELHSSLLENN